MSDDDDDLFANSGDDTDDLIAESKKKPIAKPKKLKKKSAVKKRKRDKSIPDADADDDDDDGGGLFASDDEGKKLSKKERMERMQAKRRQENRSAGGDGKKSSRGDGRGGDGYASEDTADSAEFVRNEADIAFIDTEGDDEDAVAELYAEQNFSGGEAEEEPVKKKKIRGVGSSSNRGRSEISELKAEGDKDNPLMQAVYKMQRRKKLIKKPTELEDEAIQFIGRMKEAATEDEQAVSERRPALKKLAMLSEVCDTLANRELTRALLGNDLLSVCKLWIQPLPNGQLGNVTVRSRVLNAVSLMNGEQGINAEDLKRSGFGKVVMSLYKHRSETPTIKRQLKSLIEQWSRPIFQKSGNMRDLERVHHARGATGISQISRLNHMEEQARQQQHNAPVMSQHRGGKNQDLNSLIKSGSKGKTESGINRVRVPFSKGFQYTVRPTNRTAGAVDKRRQQGAASGAGDSRGKLGKRMIEKSRVVSRNVRSANVSVEGRQAK